MWMLPKTTHNYILRNFQANVDIYILSKKIINALLIYMYFEIWPDMLLFFVFSGEWFEQHDCCLISKPQNLQHSSGRGFWREFAELFPRIVAIWRILSSPETAITQWFHIAKTRRNHGTLFDYWISLKI